MKSLAIGILLTAALVVACGSKTKSSSTTPENKTGTTAPAPMKGVNGGAGYGGTTYGGGANPDPCAGGM